MASPLDLVQKIGNTDLGPLKGILQSKKAAFAFVAFSTFTVAASETTVPVLQAVCMIAAAIVVSAYLIAQGIVDAVVAHAAAAPPAPSAPSVVNISGGTPAKA
jgi:hypothetical protein